VKNPKSNVIDGQDVRGVVATAQLRPSPLNPRKSFPDESVAELAASFREHGILSPLLVRPVGKKGASPLLVKGEWKDLDHFEVVDGERRYRAAKSAGLKHVPVTVRRLTDTEALVLMLIANDQREDVKPSERAQASGGGEASDGREGFHGRVQLDDGDLARGHGAASGEGARSVPASHVA
jgi:ParB/RepB/Spo0J family partition protein